MKKVQYIVGTKECEKALTIDNAHKSNLYHMFFGWRRTFTILDLEVMEFLFTNKEIELIERG